MKIRYSFIAISKVDLLVEILRQIIVQIEVHLYITISHSLALSLLIKVILFRNIACKVLRLGELVCRVDNSYRATDIESILLIRFFNNFWLIDIKWIYLICVHIVKINDFLLLLLSPVA